MHQFFALLLLLTVSLSVKAGDFIRTSDGVIVHPDAAFSGNAKDVQLKVIADNIRRRRDLCLMPLEMLKQ